MIINETVLIEKFSESDDKGYDYLIDNATNDEEISILQSLQTIFNSIGKEITFEEYKDYRNLILQEEIGLKDNLLAEINNIE